MATVASRCCSIAIFSAFSIASNERTCESNNFGNCEFEKEDTGGPTTLSPPGEGAGEVEHVISIAAGSNESVDLACKEDDKGNC